MPELEKLLIVLSFSPPSAEATRELIVPRARRAAEKLGAARDAVEQRSPDGDTVLLAKGLSGLGGWQESGEGCALLTAGAYDCYEGREVHERDLLERFRTIGPEVLQRIGPPFAACLQASFRDAFVAASDSCGLYHLYCYEGRGWSGVSSSSLALGFIARESLDREAAGTFALLGNLLEEQSMVRKVRKLGPGELCRLHQGRLTIERCAPAEDPAALDSMTQSQAIETGIEVVRACVTAGVASFGEVDLLLSGGLDSRLVLAAIPESLRSSVHAVTIGIPGDADHRLSSRIADATGVAHDFVDVSRLEGLRDEDALGLVRDAGLFREYAANPLAASTLEWVERQLPARPRVSGQNGEFARGFYYAGQPTAAKTTPELVHRLARWRLFVSDSIDVRMLAEPFYEEIRSAVLGRIEKMFDAYGEGWLSGTDELYLRARMARWAGTEQTRASRMRASVCPFFDPRFIAWARSVSPADRRGPELFARMIERLDPKLATIPLDRGLSPADLARPGLRSTLHQFALFGVKAGRKVRQRMLKLGNVPLGADLMRRKVLSAKGGSEWPLSRSVGILDESRMQAVASGRSEPPGLSLSFLLDLEGVLEVLGDGG